MERKINLASQVERTLNNHPQFELDVLTKIALQSEENSLADLQAIL